MASTRCDLRAPAARIVVAGGLGAGRTTFVSAISQIPPINTDRWMTQAGRHVVPLTGGEGKVTTTVAIDFGRLTLAGGLVLYLFGTPGQARFWTMWDDLCRSASAAVILADTRHLDRAFAAVGYFEHDCDVSYVVAVNRLRRPADPSSRRGPRRARAPRSRPADHLRRLPQTVRHPRSHHCRAAQPSPRPRHADPAPDDPHPEGETVRRILIVGAGQSGLQLALSLPRDRYEVTVMSARTPQEIRVGRITSTQVMFAPPSTWNANTACTAGNGRPRRSPA